MGRQTVGGRIRELREQRGLTQAELAGGGVSKSYLSRIERDQRTPSVQALRAIARNLGVSVSYLETGRDLAEGEELELRLADAELQLRLAGDLAEAEAELRVVLKDAQAAGERQLATRARVALGLAASCRGDHAEVIRRLAPLTRGETICPVAHPEAYAVLGRAYVEQGEGAAGVRLYRHCLERCQAPEHASLYIRFAGYLAAALVDTGDPAAAEQVIEATQERARSLTDPYARIRLYWAQSRIQSAQGHGRQALAAMRNAILLLASMEDTLQLGRAELIYGELLLNEHRLADAAPHLERAAELLEGNAEVQDRAFLCSERAKLEARRGNPRLALDLAGQALDLLAGGDLHEQGRALWARGEALAALGRPDDAVLCFHQAYGLVRADHGVHPHELPILHAWASTLEAAGRDASRVRERIVRTSLRRIRPSTPVH